MTRPKNARSLARIEADLEAAFKREARGPIEIGGLLLEAKEQLSHGQWLIWLNSNFPHSVSTCENYINAAKFAAKFPTVVNLKVSPTGFYALAKSDNDGDAEVVKRALHEAETKWVDAVRVHQIVKELRPPPLPPADEEESDDDTAPDDDQPPPPAPPPINPKQARLVRDFDGAVAAFKTLVTKRASEFAAASTLRCDLEVIGNFLLQVARQVSR